MKPAEMLTVERQTGFDDWTDPQLSAIYWAAQGRCVDILNQAIVLYRRNHKEK